MENNLDYAKDYLLKTNFEFFTQAEQNVIGKTMFQYANHILENRLEIIQAKLIKLNSNLSANLQTKRVDQSYELFTEDLSLILDDIRLMKR
jgi:hypothetical protein